MLTYYNSENNNYYIRIQNLINNNNPTLLYLEDMDSQIVSEIILSNKVYDEYNGTLNFTFELNGVNEGDQFRSYIKNTDKVVWRGSFQVDNNSTSDKKVYETRLNSNTVANNNDYIILEN